MRHRGYGRNMDVSSPWRVLAGEDSRKEPDWQAGRWRVVSTGTLCAGRVSGPQEEDAWVLIRGGEGEGLPVPGEDSVPF